MRSIFLSSAVVLLNVLLAIVSACPAQEPSREEQERFFENHIRPALVAHCLECHATDTEASGNLLLDSRSGWEAGGDIGPALVPGDPTASLLIQAIEYDDPDLQMPPDGKLDPQTIERFRRWVSDGAFDPRQRKTATARKPTGLPVERAAEHWAYRPLQPIALDGLPPADSPIDRFLLAKLQQANLPLEPAAEELQLLRRISFDLTGLPPTPQQIESFTGDRSPDKWATLVETLLSSPAYGETFARRWMDVARYAESITLRGFVLDEAWRYRDYLIQAYAEDRGFDQMIRDQIAGDLFGGDSLRDRQLAATATGFLAMGNSNLEDQDKTKLEFDYIDEQLETIGRAFLGQTIGCARCHDHKFDPIPTADYYALAAILRSTTALEHANLSKWIERPLPVDEATEADYEKLAQQAERLQAEIRSLQKTTSQRQVKRQVTKESLPGIVMDDSEAKLVGQWMESTSVAGYVANGYLHDSHSDRGGKTATFAPTKLAAGVYEVRMSYTPGANRATNTQVQVFSANEAKAIRINQRKPPPIDGIWISLGTFPFEENGQAFVLISNADADGHVIVDAVQFLPSTPTADSTSAAQAHQPFDQADEAAHLEQLKQSLTKIRKELGARPSYLTIAEGEPVEELAIRIRGLVHQEGPQVKRGFLSAIGRADYWSSAMTNTNSGRMELAHWLADPENPLTARVYANRIWSWLIGDGLVSTENNFGTTGTVPSHPRLLDYLAGELIQNGWSTKHLVRLIVNSDAYRRRVGSERAVAATSDPDNRLLWSANLRRIPVEGVRDAMLLVSGELDRTRLGSSLRPGTNVDYNYRHDSMRRSVYQPVLRNALPPLYQVFDFADSSVSVGQRSRSTVATQSLVMMNHPWVIRRAERAAIRFQEQMQNDPAVMSRESIRQLYQVCLGRYPTDSEVITCQDYLHQGQPGSTERLAGLIHSLFASIDFRYLE